MKMLASLLCLGLMATPAFAATRASMMFRWSMWPARQKAAADADGHTRECALACEKSGFGIVTEDKKFLKFDADGNAKVLEQLKSTDKKDHLRVNVSGDVKGDTINVTSVKLL